MPLLFYWCNVIQYVIYYLPSTYFSKVSILSLVLCCKSIYIIPSFLNIVEHFSIRISVPVGVFAMMLYWR